MTDRRNPLASHGFVNFPNENPRFRDTGEGGCAVFAVWEKDHPDFACCNDALLTIAGSFVGDWFDEETSKAEERAAESAMRMVKVHTGVPVLTPRHPEDIEYLKELRAKGISASGPLRYIFNSEAHPDIPEDVRAGIEYVRGTFHSNGYVSVAGIIYLGSSGGSWWDDHKDEHWQPTLEDLTDEGRQFVELASKLYGTQPRLILMWDT